MAKSANEDAFANMFGPAPVKKAQPNVKMMMVPGMKPKQQE